MFFPELLDRRLHTRLKRRILNDIACAPLLRRTFLHNLRPPIPAPLHKVPLVRWGEGKSFFDAAHHLLGGTFGGTTGALLHFKFLGDFNNKVAEETVRKVYGNNSERYTRYAARLDRQGVPLDFMCELSTRYEGTAQLVGLGLIG